MEATLSAARKQLAMLGIVVALGVAVTLSVAGYHGITVGSTFSLASSQVNPDNIRMPYTVSNLLLHAGCGAVEPTTPWLCRAASRNEPHIRQQI